MINSMIDTDMRLAYDKCLAPAIEADADPEGLDGAADVADAMGPVMDESRGTGVPCPLQLVADDFAELAHVHVRCGRMAEESGVAPLTRSQVDRAVDLWSHDVADTASRHHPRNCVHVDDETLRDKRRAWRTRERELVDTAVVTRHPPGAEVRRRRGGIDYTFGNTRLLLNYLPARIVLELRVCPQSDD
jgi:hypothetical protein